MGEAKPPLWVRLFLWAYVILFAVDHYFVAVNGFNEWTCLDLNDDGHPGVCLGMGDWGRDD